jgi:hypothetical protein
LNEVQPKVHVLCLKTILADLTQGKINGTPVVHKDSGNGGGGVGKDFK